MASRRLAEMRWIGIVAGLIVAAAIVMLARDLLSTFEGSRRATGLPGVTLEQIDTSGGPALVVTSVRSAPAPYAMLQVGDRIESIDDLPVKTNRALRSDMARLSGSTMEIQLWRKGRREQIRMARRTGG